MEIGNRIRTLRKNRGITQEQLALRLGISFQAVSKWENNLALPDITMMPVLADFFQVSLDDLFDYKKERIWKEVDKICQDAYPLREKDPAAARRILEDGLEKYPGNDLLTNHLLYVMKNPEEVIETAGRLASQCQKFEIRFDALRFLAYAYKAKGDQKHAEAAFILEGEKKYEAASKQKWISLEIALQMFIKTAEYFAEQGKSQEAVREADMALGIMELLKGKENGNLKIYENYLKKWKEKLMHLLHPTVP